ncbi:MAG: glutathione S-transferase family protein [Betaproteobacteria bacterium]
MILYGLPVSTYTAKVRLALCWRGIAFEEREPPGGYRSLAWRDIVPMGTIPAIDDQGFLLAESEAILEYLEERFSDRPLLPQGPQRRAQVRLLARMHDLHVEPKVRALFPLLRQPQERDHLPQLKAALLEKIAVLARTARPGPYLAGPEPTLADCGFAVTLPLAERVLNTLGSPLKLPEVFQPWLAALAADRIAQRALASWSSATDAWLKAVQTQ